MATPRYSLRSSKSASSASAVSVMGVPMGFTRLDLFNAGTNKYGKLSGLTGQPVDETGIYVKEYGKSVLLWWGKPALQIDDFVYTGKSQEDIDTCNAQMGKEIRARGLTTQHTWHHTGHPSDESYGTMQYVETSEHSVLPHVGGASISRNGS